MGFHAEQAYEQAFNMWLDGECDGDGDFGGRSSYDPDPLFYHNRHTYESITEETEKAYLIRMETYMFWVPKSLCREHNKEACTVYIWNNFEKTKLPVDECTYSCYSCSGDTFSIKQVNGRVQSICTNCGEILNIRNKPWKK